jgi:hypothetical protein
VNCDFTPFAIAGFGGVTPRDTRLAAVTVKFVEPDRPLNAALIMVEPGPCVVANPFDPGMLLTEATPATEELHVTELVKS